MKKIITYLIITIVLISAGYFIWRDTLVPKGPVAKTTKSGDGQTAVATTTASSAENTAVTSLKIPDFSKIIVDPSITGAVKAKLIADLQTVITTLKGNVMNPAAWVQLGILRQNAKDYDGAVSAWNFASTLSSQNAIPLLDIANLYGYFKHDNVKAEEYFKKAIVTEPTSGYAYFKAYEFYTDINEPAKARAVLEQGVAANPTDQQLQAALNSLK